MIEATHTAQIGRAATERLVETVRAAQEGDPLRRVTVVAPSNFSALSLRRRLGEEGAGVANVDAITLSALVERLSTGLVDAPPLSPTVLRAAVRRTLAEEPGSLAPVASHPATEDAVATLYQEVSELTDGALDALRDEGGRAGRDAVELVAAIAERHGGLAGPGALATAVAAAPDLTARTASLGHVVWFLPEPTARRPLAALGAVLAATPSSVIVGWCGDPVADEATAAACRVAGVDVRAPDSGSEEASEVATITAGHVTSATDADDEVRIVLRAVAGLLAEGVHPGRIGIFHPAPVPYARALRQQLAAAGVPASGPGALAVRDSVAGRTVSAALDLHALRWRRDTVLALVSGGPVLDGDRIAPAARWERLSRSAGVVADLADWRRKLDTHRRALERSAERGDPSPGDAASGAESGADRDVAECDRLRQFVDALAARLDEVRDAATWADRSAATHRLLDHLLDDAIASPRWPDDERRAMGLVRSAIDRLATLDPIDPAPTFEAFARALDAELDGPVGREGRFGAGVLHGHLSAAIGVDLDAVFVLGGIEGLLPHGRRDDALLPDRARAATAGELPTRNERTADQHRRYLAALAAAPEGRRWVSYPRGDLRGHRRTTVSRWVDDARTDAVASFVAGVAAATAPASLAERDLSAVIAWRSRGADPAQHPAMAPVQRGVVAQRSRRSAAFTEWDGHIGEGRTEISADATWSATPLEAWAACGHRYLFEHVLRVRDRDDPEGIVDLQPLDRGSLLHTILERFVREAIDAGEPRVGEPWSEKWRARLMEIAEEEFASLQRRGRTGRELTWRRTRAGLVDDLAHFLAHDDAHRAEGWHPEAVEWAFGSGDVPPAVVALDDGRHVRFRGRIDRVDRRDDGARMVIDYKTGRAPARGRGDDDPVAAGTRLQLGIYALAVAQRLAAHEVATAYWHVRAGERIHPPRSWSPDHLARLDEVVRAAVEGIEAGVHPADPGEWSIFRNTHENCTYCPYDVVCPRDRGEHAVAKAGDAALGVRRALRREVQP